MSFVRLREIAETLQGGRLRLSGKHFVESGFPAYGAGGLNGHIDVAEFDEAAIVLSAIGARCGKCFLTESQWTSLANTRVIFPDPEQVDIRFLWYQLNDESRWPRSGAAQPFIRPSDVDAHEIFLPALDEQKRIVAVLDQAFAALDRARTNADAGLADAKELRDSIVSDFLEKSLNGESRRIRLGELCSIARGGSPRPIQKFLTDDPDGVNWIKISDATASDIFIEETQQKISRDGMARSRYVTPGAFLLTNSMSFGRPYILKTDGCIHDGWLVLEPNYKLVEQTYLYYLLGSRQVYRDFDRQAAGSTVRNLNIDLVSKVFLTLPTMDKQREAVASIAGALRSTEGLMRAYSKQMGDNLALRQSLLQAAFSGHLN